MLSPGVHNRSLIRGPFCGEQRIGFSDGFTGSGRGSWVSKHPTEGEVVYQERWYDKQRSNLTTTSSITSLQQHTHLLVSVYCQILQLLQKCLWIWLDAQYSCNGTQGSHTSQWPTSGHLRECTVQLKHKKNCLDLSHSNSFQIIRHKQKT